MDLGAWPVALLARTAGDVVDADDDGVVGALGALLDRKQRFGLVLDLGRQSEAQQAELSGWLHRNRVRAQRYVVGCALVLPPATVERARDLLSARPDLYPFPAWVAASRDECFAWVEGVLASSGPLGRSRER